MSSSCCVSTQAVSTSMHKHVMVILDTACGRSRCTMSDSLAVEAQCKGPRLVFFPKLPRRGPFFRHRRIPLQLESTSYTDVEHQHPHLEYTNRTHKPEDRILSAVQADEYSLTERYIYSKNGKYSRACDWSGQEWILSNGKETQNLGMR